MAVQESWLRRWEVYRASKTVLFWACAGCAVATMVVGFAWGGWMTGGNAAQMAAQAATDARAEVVATLCVQRFATSADATAKFTALKGTDSWKQDKFIEEGGWVTLPGTKDPVEGAATLCARQLSNPSPTAKAASTSG